MSVILFKPLGREDRFISKQMFQIRGVPIGFLQGIPNGKPGHPELKSKNRTQNMTVRTGKAEQDIQDRKKSGKETYTVERDGRRVRTAKTGRPRQDSQDRTART